MRKLVQTMLKYDKETSFQKQADLMQDSSYNAAQDYVSVNVGGGHNRQKTIALASQHLVKKKRNKSKYAKSCYNPTSNLSVFGHDKEDSIHQNYEGHMSPYKASISPARSAMNKTVMNVKSKYISSNQTVIEESIPKLQELANERNKSPGYPVTARVT